MNAKLLSPLALVALLALGHCARPLASGALTAGVEAADSGDWEEAVRQWTIALEHEPRSAAAHNNLAVAYERQGAWEEARREYEAAIGFDPDNRAIRENYRDFLARLGPGRRRTL